MILLMAGSAGATAQFRTGRSGGSSRPISFAFGGGASVPVGSYKDALKAGWNGQGAVIFNFAGLPLAFRADLNYNKFTFKEKLTFSPSAGGTIAASDDVTQHILGGLANITIPRVGVGPVRPYVYTDKRFISNTELKALQFVPITFGFVF